MAQYLTEEQRARLQAQLGEEAPGEQEEPKDDIQEADASLEAIRAAGFESAEELIGAYRNMGAAVEELKEMLEQLLDMEQAAQTAARLDPTDPEYAARAAVAAELKPLREQARRAARARLIQEEWKNSAARMEDLQALLPEIAEYIMRNPRYAGESDGLLRAYDAVRSARYRDEKSLMADPEFIQRAARDEGLREAVLRAHMEEIRRRGGLPQPVGMGNGGGAAPATRARGKGMEQARRTLSAMLGVRDNGEAR